MINVSCKHCIFLSKVVNEYHYWAIYKPINKLKLVMLVIKFSRRMCLYCIILAQFQILEIVREV